MRFMVLVKANEHSEAVFEPEDFAADMNGRGRAEGGSQ